MIAVIVCLVVVIGVLATSLTVILSDIHRRVEDAVSAERASASNIRVLLLERITDLENRLMSHSWGEYSQLQNSTMAAPERVRAMAQPPEPESSEGAVEDFLARQGIFTDGSVLP